MVPGPSRAGGSSSSYTGYNELESAWGYFDSRDLGNEESDEDQLLEDDHRQGRSHTSLRRTSQQSLVGPGSSNTQGPGRPLSHMPQRTSDMRSTRDSSEEDTPMRLRDDSPMRTR